MTSVTLRRRSRAALLLLALGSAAAGAQQPAAATDSSAVIRLRDKSTVAGHLVRQTPDSIEITTAAGRMTFARSAVASVKVVSSDELHDGQYWASDPHYTRLFFGPTGRTLARGEGYFSDTELFFLNTSWGLTDRFMLGGGLSVFPSSDMSNNVFYVTPKVLLKGGERFNVSAGALIGFAGHENGSAGMLYVAASNGSRDNQLTYGAGWAYFNDKIAGDAALMLGGTRRVSRRVSLMTENYLFTGSGGGYVLPMYGMRFFGESIAADLGFVNFLGRDTHPIFPGAPWVGFALKF
ncbi:MAG: hypothetical protein ACYC3L_13870 [Gemmatimonadaceae bacterium]